MRRELTYALRSLRRTPVFTASAILILTLSVGATTAVFSLLYALVLRPLPVPSPYSLVQISTRQANGREGDLSWRQFGEFGRRQSAFSTVIASIHQGVVTVETGQALLKSSVTGVSGNYYAELGAAPALGRLIQPIDGDIAKLTAEPVAVVSWTFWQQHFGGDPAVLGQSVAAEGIPLTIIGVAPREFLGVGITIEPDLTVPIALLPKLLDSEAPMIDGTAPWISTTGRLASGETLASARAEITALWPDLLEAAMPASLSPAQRDDYLSRTVQVESGAYGIERGLRGRYTKPLYALLAIALLVLLIAASNLCFLIFARASSRRNEFGIRLAVGASRIRLVRESAVEGTVLGVAGSAAGLAVAAYASDAITTFLLRDYIVRTSLDVSPNVMIAGVAAVGGIGTAVAVTVIAAWLITRPSTGQLASGGSRTFAPSWRIGRILVGAQVALSIVLLSHTSILGRNVVSIVMLDSGLTHDTVLVGSPTARVGRYRELDPARYYREALDRVMTVPGVAAASFSMNRPQGGGPPPEPIGPAGTPIDAADVSAEATQISPGFFATVGVPIIRGRDFTYADGESSRRVAIISQQLERRLFGDRSGIGEHVRISRRPEWQQIEIVGIAGDARVYDVRGGNQSIAYVPALQSGALAHYKFLLARAPAGASLAIQQAIDGLGVEFITRFQTLEYARGRAILQERLMAALGGAFSAVALLLVSAGIYGLLSYVLSLRRKEIGIRIALGAQANQIARAILADGLRATALGVVAGSIGAVASLPLLRSVVVGTGGYDPVAIAAACLALVLVTLAAAMVPAARAARVEPLAELRRD